MTDIQIINHTNDALIARFSAQIEGIAKELTRRLLSALITGIIGLKYKNARATFTIENTRAAGRTLRVVGRTVALTRDELLKELPRHLVEIFVANEKYFQAQDINLSERARRQAIARILLLYGYDEKNKQVIPGSQLERVLNLNPVVVEIGRALNAGLGAQDSFEQLRDRVVRIITPPDRANLAERLITRSTSELYAQYDRETKNQIAEIAGAQSVAIYAGTAVDDTRPFCMARYQNFYTKDEILRWDNRRWVGKISGVPVVVQCGGYNCRHTLNWVTPEVADRMMKRYGKVLNEYRPVPGGATSGGGAVLLTGA
jgi:hypothetical protein